METRNYWGYRIDITNVEYFWNELLNGRLRQGWGWLGDQDLRNPNIAEDEGARKNIPMIERVKENDILLVPGLPDSNNVTIVEATEDWDTGYRFQINEAMNDYGHIFPARYIRHFARYSGSVPNSIMSTLRCERRFWNIRDSDEDIEILLRT